MLTFSVWGNGRLRPFLRCNGSNYMDNQTEQMYSVVVNHEEQYSIWPADRAIPAGWQAVGHQGSKEACLAYINQVWTDMRPLSLRQKDA